MNLRRRQQKGQALIASLVAMVVLFSIAGGLAVAVSAALDSGSSAWTYLRDVKAQSSSAAVLSTVAGGPRSCPTGTLFGSVSGYSCDEIDAISPSGAAMARLVGDSTCATAPLPAARHIAVWLHSMSGFASLRVNLAPSSCGADPTDCLGSGSPSGAVYLYVIRDCGLGASGTAYVHFSGGSGSAAVARLAPLASFLPKFKPISVGVSPAPIIAVRLRGVSQPLDLLVGERAGGVSVLLNRGDGYFPGVQATYLPTTPISAIALADLEGNGSQYVMAGSAVSSAVSILRGAGDGSFQPLQSFSVGDPPTALLAAPLIGSGNLDLVSASLIGHSITVVPGNGDGTFQSTSSRTFSPLSTCKRCPGLSPVAVAQVNQPGGRTLLAVATAEGVLLLYAVTGDCDGQCDNSGSGWQRWGKFTLIDSQPLGGSPTAMVVANLNGDSYPDLAVTLHNQVDVFFGQSNGLALATTVSLGSSLSAIAAGHLGGGPLADLAVTDAATNTVTALLNRNGALQPALGGSADTGLQPSGVAAGDFGGTGVGGLAVTNGRENTVSVLFRNQSRVFAVVGAGPVNTESDEADLVWTDLAQTNTLLFEGGLSR